MTVLATGWNWTYSYSARRKMLRVSATSKPAPTVKPYSQSESRPAVPVNENGVHGGVLLELQAPEVGGFCSPEVVSVTLTFARPTATPTNPYGRKLPSSQPALARSVPKLRFVTVPLPVMLTR